jgi:hypothetical protein
MLKTALHPFAALLGRTAWLLLTVASLSANPSYAAPQTVHLLTIGNSFADNALTYLPQMVDSTGNILVVSRANLGGASLQRHWKHAEAYEANQADPYGRPYAKGTLSLAELLAQAPWNVVTLQQVSSMGHDPKSFHPYIEKLVAYIHERAPQAKIILHQTWAYRIDERRALR